MELIETAVLTVIQRFLTDLGNDRALRALTTQAFLEKDLGLGSLERVELMLRLRQEFGVQLPEETLYQAQTVQDVIVALQHAQPSFRHELTSARKPALHPAIAPPAVAKTLLEVIRYYVETVPERPHIYLPTQQGQEEIISYRQLWESAHVIASGLLQQGIGPHTQVVLLLPTCAAFFYAFFGVLLIGATPVPLYPPHRLGRIQEYAQRQALVLRNAQAKLLITTPALTDLAGLLKPLVPELRAVLVAEELLTAANHWPEVPVGGQDTALIQYTSGSTGNPKGVQLTHNNLLANIRAIGQALQLQPTDVVVSWLPLYHDMGLIGAWLGSLYFGVPFILLSPLTFLTQPERWLWTIHAYRGTVTAAPNFAYELCLRKINDALLEGLDLSSLRLSLNGAEPVNAATLERFQQRFAPYGFRAEAMLPVYGLAENSVALTISPLGRVPRIDYIDRNLLAGEGRAQPVKSGSTALRVVACGRVIPGHELRIVDDQDRVLDERREGRLQFRGPSAMIGYFNAPEQTRAIEHQGWWDSGDLAYLADGEVFITARKKDIIIKAGRNYYPQELEDIVGTVPGVRVGCVAAFGVTDAQLGTERIIVVAEVRQPLTDSEAQLVAQINAAVASILEEPPDVVHLVAPGVIPKTSSGKLRRAACKEAYLRHKLTTLHPRASPAWQIARVWLAGLLGRVRAGLRWCGWVAYSGYCYVVFALTLLLFWPLAVVVPANSRVFPQLTRYWSKLMLSLMGCRPQVIGLTHLDKNRPSMLLVNHASYLDSVVLCAALPLELVFVAKQELLRTFFLRPFLNKQQHILVDRQDFARGVAHTQAIEAALRRGRWVVIYPEGTFTRARGIRPFKLGAFKAAVDSQMPLTPVVIRGTRQVFSSDSWLLRPHAIHIAVLPPLYPQGKDLAEMVRLRDAVRQAMAVYSGDPILNLTMGGVSTKEG